jgi:hypothetical protein
MTCPVALHRMRAAPRPEAVAESYTVVLIDGIQHFGSRTLDNLVLERWYAERPTAAVAFWDVRGGVQALASTVPCGRARVDAGGYSVASARMHSPSPDRLRDWLFVVAAGTLVRAPRHRRDEAVP